MFEKLRIPILLTFTFLGGAAAAGVSWGVTNERVTQAREDIARIQETNQERAKSDEATALRLQALELELKAANRALERIEARLGTK